MVQLHATTLLAAERRRLERLLAEVQAHGARERVEGDGPIALPDAADSLSAVGVDGAIAASLRQRIDSLRRAEQRVADGTYGRSVLSGIVIPDARLEADPAAETTVGEATGHV